MEFDFGVDRGDNINGVGFFYLKGIGLGELVSGLGW